MTRDSSIRSGADGSGDPIASGVRLLVVDDQLLFRRAAVRLATASGLEVVGQARSGEEAVAMATKLRPDAVLMDVRMAGIGGLEATRRILAANAAIRVLLISTYDRSDLPADYQTCGAVGFHRKQDLDSSALLPLMTPTRP